MNLYSVSVLSGLLLSGALAVCAAEASSQSALKALPADKLAQASLAAGMSAPKLSKPKPYETEYPAYAGQGTDISSSYLSSWDSAEKPVTAEEAAQLGRYKILLVPGFLGNSASGDGQLVQVNLPGFKVDIGKMFSGQMKWMTDNGLQFEFVTIETEAAPMVNARTIASRVEASDRPVILIGHSKGGVDSLHALVKYPELAKKVAVFISVQSPFLGSPVADAVMASKSLNNLAKHILKSLGGTKASLVSLTTKYGVTYYERKKTDIARVLRTVKVVNFCSWKNEEPGRVDTVLEPLRDGMANVGLDNDGLVPVQSQILPGATYIKVEGWDHLGPVMDNSVLKLDQVRFLRAITSLALK